MSDLRVLIVDLNNFARYPTLAVGYLSSILRKEKISTHVLSPLAHGVEGMSREPVETLWQDVARRTSFSLAGARGIGARVLPWVQRSRRWYAERSHVRIVQLFDSSEPFRYDVVLVSAYLMYHRVCEEIGRRCDELGVPLLIGGSYFADDEVAKAWLSIPGLTALVRGEVEADLADLTRAAATHADLSQFEGVSVPGRLGMARAPLTLLDDVPIPDFSGFPWHRYPVRIVPVITGRGCGWGVCSFCSDVQSATGRSFRTRRPDLVLDELEEQSRRYEACDFVFTDLKLNSNLEMWTQLIESLPARVNGPAWICSVHVGTRGPNGLDRRTLEAARRAGLQRITTGLESASQRLLDSLHKGTDLATSSRFFHDARAAGVSVRVTMMHGSPGETEDDVIASAGFLERHRDAIDRVNLNRFQFMLGTRIMHRYDACPEQLPDIEAGARIPHLALADHRLRTLTAGYRRATQRLLRAVHEINRKSLDARAQQFIGVM